MPRFLLESPLDHELILQHAAKNSKHIKRTMTEVSNLQKSLADGLTASYLVARGSWRRVITSWLYVPVGTLVVLLLCFGVDSLIRLSHISFPASVACMLILFFALVACEAFMGERNTREVVRIVDIPAGFALRYINVFFTPSFVLLPLSPSISGIEVAKIIAVFIVGFVVMVAATAYFVRGLELVLGKSKRAITERAEEMGQEDDEIPLTNLPELEDNGDDVHTAVPASPSTYSFPSGVQAPDLVPPPRAQDPSEVRGTGGPPVNAVSDLGTAQTILRQDPVPLTRPQRWAAWLNVNLDAITYGVFFLLIGIPVYYTTGYAMPAQLSFNVLAYFVANSLPTRYKQFLHPVLVSSAVTVIGIWILALVRRDSLRDGLLAYSTKTGYLQVWEGQKGLSKPGAGDIFGSVLNVSIVALALPMFQYRHELKKHFISIAIPNLAMSIASLFGYPALCYAVGISSKRSLSFAARSLTLALATPATKNLGGDISLVAPLCIMSGILGVIIGPQMLKWLRIPEDDYVTRGVTLGGNSSAIATALLLVSDPRAAALSSLSMSLFGISMVALTSVPPVVRIVSELVGLSQAAVS